jgi:hypothetical protein
VRAIELVGVVDEQYRVNVNVPDWVPLGPVHVLVLVPDAGDQDLAETANVLQRISWRATTTLLLGLAWTAGGPFVRWTRWMRGVR